MKDKNVAGSRMGSISNGVKKTTLILSVLSFFALASTAFAQGFVPLAPIPGLTEGATADTAGLANFFNNLYKYLIGLAAALAVIEIIWGGLEISTQDSVSKNKDGKDRIYQAIFGLVLVLSPVLVFSIINPSILNLSLNLDPLDTKSTPTNTAPTTQSTQLSAPDTQLRQSQGVQILETFSLPLGLNLTEKKRLLDAKQIECTNNKNGPGIVMQVVGDIEKYTCQTCPPNTSIRLNPPGGALATPRGTCNPN